MDNGWIISQKKTPLFNEKYISSTKLLKFLSLADKQPYWAHWWKSIIYWTSLMLKTESHSYVIAWLIGCTCHLLIALIQ